MIKDLQMLIGASESIEITNMKMIIKEDVVLASGERIKFNFIKGKVELA